MRRMHGERLAMKQKRNRDRSRTHRQCPLTCPTQPPAGLVRLIPAPSVASLVPTVVFLSSYETTSRELLQVIEIGGDCCNLGLGQAARNRFHYGGCVWFCRIAVPVIAPIHQGF